MFSHELSAQTATSLTRQETDSLVLNYCNVLDQTYFNKPKSKEIIELLRKKLKAGDFYNVTHLTDRLSLLLREITKDSHFYIGVTQPADPEEMSQETAPESIYQSSGFSEIRIINNTIGYIKWTEFVANEESFKKVIGALQFIQGSKALILDLSECPGGDGRMGGFVNAHLFEANDYQNLLIKKCTGESEWHQSEVPYNYSNGPKLYDLPVFVIVSKNTGSAAEYFALTIKEMKRGVVLGSTTAGAGNPSVMVTFRNYFAVIPICEIITRDAKSIEGKGVVPNVELKTDNWIKETLTYIENHY